MLAVQPWEQMSSWLSAPNSLEHAQNSWLPAPSSSGSASNSWISAPNSCRVSYFEIEEQPIYVRYSRRSIWWKHCQDGWPFTLIGCILAASLAAIPLGIVLTMYLYANNIATTVPSTTRTTTSTTSTTSISCPTGYVRTPSNVCVNLLTDFNNCGSIGYICASNYTSCFNGTCSVAPAVLLQGGVSVPGWGGSVNTDDAFVTVTMPFAISLYGYSTMNVSIQTNGCICLGGCSATYSNGNLPASSFSGPTAFGYWDDLYIYSGTAQTVYYGATGTSPNRSAVFEYYMAHISAPTQWYHFQVIFYEALPNIVQYLYYQVGDGGASATIGVQASSTGPSMTYSVNNVSIPYGSATTTTPTLTLTFNTMSGTYTSSG